MLLSGYHLSIHLLNSTSDLVGLERKKVISDTLKLKIEECQLTGSSHRNSLFRIYIDGKEKYHVKQPRVPTYGSISSLINQRKILEIFSGFAELKNHNTLAGFDDFQKILFEDFQEGEKLEGLSQLYENEDWLPQIGEELTKIHSIQQNINTGPEIYGYRKPLFLILQKRDINDLLQEGNLSKDQIWILEWLKKDSWKLFEKIRGLEWKEDALIHYDLKLEHLIFKNDGLCIVDWEMADCGDYYYDLACLYYAIYRVITELNSSVEQEAAEANAFFNLATRIYGFPIDADKLKGYIFLIFVTKIYYGLFYGVTSDKTEAILNWFSSDKPLAVKASLVKRPDKKKFQKNGAKKDKPAEAFPTHADDIVDSINEINELLTQIRKGTVDLGKDENECRRAIYGWINGSFDDELIKIGNEISKDRMLLAKTPLVGKEDFNNDHYWLIDYVSASNSLVIRKNSEKRFAHPGTYIYTKDILKHANNFGNGDKSHVRLTFPQFIVRPNDADPESSDLWVIGDQQIKQDSANWLRFYFHLDCKLEGILYFVETMTQLLNERFIPFELKLRNKLSSYYRRDPAILFVHRNHFTALSDVLGFIYNDLKGKKYLRSTSTSKFTFSFKKFQGISYAENPYDDKDSFGNARAKLLSGFIFDRKNEIHDKNFKKKLINYLKNNGYNPHKLYRNPYPIESEYKYNYGILKAKLARPPRLVDLDFNFQLKLNASSRFLLAARKIGFIICREAVWYGDRCNWLSIDRPLKRDIFFRNLTAPEKSGIALFLSGLYYYFPGDGIFYDCANAALKPGKNLENDPQKLYPIISQRPELKLQFPAKFYDEEGTVTKIYSEEFINVGSDSKYFAETLMERYTETRLPFPHAFSAGMEDPLSSELNFTVTHGLGALGYFFLWTGANLMKEKEGFIKPIKTFT